ncbi:MAG: ribonuclease HII [Bacteroidetes bacterium]|nr:ribonuclease HII [Bacteroidota bacterium]
MLKPYFDKSLLEAGCDEAGRGCLAGPVFAAAVILPKSPSLSLPEGKGVSPLRGDGRGAWTFLEKVNDSKKLTHEVRMELRPIIEKIALSYVVEKVSVEEIDEINILNASFLAMHRAIAKLEFEPELLLIDGNRFTKYNSTSGKKIAHQCIIEGDGKYLSIACASILAKTYRDDYMNELHEKFPNYIWNQNKGYATRAHRFAIEQFGATEHHRKSFTLLPSQYELDF